MGGGKNIKHVKEFLDGINDEHFENWSTKQYTIVNNYKIGMRLDHQGMNQDGTHRIWIQPLSKGKSRNISAAGSGNYIARAHVADGSSPADVKAALVESTEKTGSMVNVG
ncbi:MAG: hypothetical protein Q9191_003171 [Dirinaria sp. TL-2023a]